MQVALVRRGPLNNTRQMERWNIQQGCGEINFNTLFF